MNLGSSLILSERKSKLRHWIIFRYFCFETLIFSVAAGVTSTKAEQYRRWLTYLRGGAQWRGKAGFVYTISLRVGITSTRPARILRGCCVDALTPVSCHSVSVRILCCCCCCCWSVCICCTSRAEREPCATSEAGPGGLHSSSDARPIWLARHWQEPSHESRWLTCGRIHRDCPTPAPPLPLGRRTRHLSQSWKEKWNKSEMAQIKMLLLAAIIGENGVNLKYGV